MEMMVSKRLAFVVVAGMCWFAGAARAGDADPASAPPGLPSTAVEVSQPFANPYLPEGFAPDETALLPPPPDRGSAAQARDDAAFAATRRLKDTARWSLAQHDADDKPEGVLRDFSCAVGTPLDPERLPAAMTLLRRVNSDTYRAVSGPKTRYGRGRPLVGNSEPICLARTDALARSPSFPSGHATIGWTYALILAELVPGRATAVLERGRAYGESRVVCGVHWLSDVEAGRLGASALVAALHGSVAFRADLDRARDELAAAAREAAPPFAGEACRPEAEAVTAGQGF